MPGKSFTSPKKGGGVAPLGKRSLENLATKFLPNAYPTFHRVATDRVSHRPTSAAVFGFTATKTGSDSRLSTPLEQLSLADVIGLFDQFTFQIDTYLSGTKIKGDSYVLEGKLPDAATPLKDGHSFTSKFNKLSLIDIVALLSQATITLTNQSSGQSKSYKISGDIENDLEDDAKLNPHLTRPVAPLSPKYVFILMRFFRFTATPTNPGQGISGNVVGGKVLGE